MHEICEYHFVWMNKCNERQASSERDLLITVMGNTLSATSYERCGQIIINNLCEEYFVKRWKCERSRNTLWCTLNVIYQLLNWPRYGFEQFSDISFSKCVEKGHRDCCLWTQHTNNKLLDERLSSTFPWRKEIFKCRLWSIPKWRTQKCKQQRCNIHQ